MDLEADICIFYIYCTVKTPETKIGGEALDYVATMSVSVYFVEGSVHRILSGVFNFLVKEKSQVVCGLNNGHNLNHRIGVYIHDVNPVRLNRCRFRTGQPSAAIRWLR